MDNEGLSDAPAYICFGLSRHQKLRSLMLALDLTLVSRKSERNRSATDESSEKDTDKMNRPFSIAARMYDTGD